jgi:hypothetical protein
MSVAAHNAIAAAAAVVQPKQFFRKKSSKIKLGKVKKFRRKF